MFPMFPMLPTNKSNVKKLVDPVVEKAAVVRRSILRRHFQAHAPKQSCRGYTLSLRSLLQAVGLFNTCLLSLFVIAHSSLFIANFKQT
jgi:hypothetical protein